MNQFIHHWEPGTSPQGPTLLLLHGTGGNEQDLVELGRSLLPGANLLSPRGKVSENGMPRFFRRLAEGVFDLEDLHFRTKELAAFIGESSLSYGFDAHKVIAVGYSNGANIAASLLLSGTATLAGAVLLHPMVPFEPNPLPALKGVPLLVTAGRQDGMVPERLTNRLVELLTAGGAAVDTVWQPGGHSLTRSELEAVHRWMKEKGETSWN